MTESSGDTRTRGKQQCVPTGALLKALSSENGDDRENENFCVRCLLILNRSLSGDEQDWELSSGSAPL